MPFEQTITVINNSGKIVSTGKHLIGIFKEARSAYKEKKEALRYERAGNVAFRRAHTFSGPAAEGVDADGKPYDGIYHSHHHGLDYSMPPLLLEDHRARRPRARLSHSRSIDGIDHGLEPTVHPRRRPAPVSPLTTSNLRTHSEISSTGPSAVPLSYQRASVLVRRPRSSLSYGAHGEIRSDTLPSTAEPLEPLEPLDMNLAYGTIPPDLVSRRDLDACASGDAAFGGDNDQLKREQAQSLVGRIESLLDEAHCIHHSAATIIAHLQSNPEAAAAVALTLAELSNLLTKMSPAFLAIVKGGSPAVFALLASPQFLIGTGIAVGVTIVLFGGWRIIKRIKETQASLDDGTQAQAFETTGPALAAPFPCLPRQPSCSHLLADNEKPPLMPAGNYEEALVLEQELSTIDTWRRGILPPFDGCDGNGDGEFRMEDLWGAADADVELISPEAMRSRIGFGVDDNHTSRSVRTHLTSSTEAGSAKPTRHRRHHHHPRAKTHQTGSSVTDAGNNPRSRASPDQKSSRAHAALERFSDGKIRGSCGDGQEDRSDRQGHGCSDRYRDDATNTSMSSSRSRHHSRRGRNNHRSGDDRRVGSRASESGSKIPAALSSSNLPTDGEGVPRIRDKRSPSTTGNMLKQLFKKKKNKEGTSRDASTAAVQAI